MANVVVDTATSFRRLPGLGIAVPVAGAQLRVGNRRLMHETDIAMETASITLMRSDPMLVADTISISQATYVKIQ